jgi:hypothetical protein
LHAGVFLNVQARECGVKQVFLYLKITRTRKKLFKTGRLCVISLSGFDRNADMEILPEEEGAHTPVLSPLIR